MTKQRQRRCFSEGMPRGRHWAPGKSRGNAPLGTRERCIRMKHISVTLVYTAVTLTKDSEHFDDAGLLVGKMYDG